MQNQSNCEISFDTQLKTALNPLQGVWIIDETLFRAFDMASQTDQ